MDDAIRRARHDIFFREHFQPVRDELKKAGGPDAIRSEAILHSTEALSFENRRNAEQEREKKENWGDRKENGHPGP